MSQDIPAGNQLKISVDFPSTFLVVLITNPSFLVMDDTIQAPAIPTIKFSLIIN